MSVAAGRRRLTTVVKVDSTGKDPSDPAAGVERLGGRERRRRLRAGLFLATLAVVVPFSAQPLTGSPGATVGAVAAAIVLCMLAVAVWPYEWSKPERAHHELAWIWRAARGGGDDEPVAWERYVVWAEPRGEHVELQLICRAPAADGSATSPSPFSRSIVRRFDADDMEAAAEAMEQLRDEAAERERRSRERHERADVAAADRAHDEKLNQIEREAVAELAAREQQLRREFAEQEAAERRAQAEAVARALRRR